MTRKTFEKKSSLIWVLLVDLFSILFCSMLSHFYVKGTFHLHDRYIIAIFTMSLAYFISALSDDDYSNWISNSVLSVIKSILASISFSAFVTVVFIYFLNESSNFDRYWISLSFLLSFTVLVIYRLISRLSLFYFQRKGFFRRNILIIGDNNSISSIGSRLRDFSNNSYTLASVIRIRSKNDAYDLVDIAEKIRLSGANEVWICLPLEMGGIVRSIMYALRNETIEVRYLPEFKDVRLLNHRVSEVVGRYAIDLSVTPMSGQARVLKRIEDLVIGSMILLLISPICIGIACAVKLTSKGPILFKQARTGANGQEVKVYKFRSMKVHQEKAGQVTQATKNDSRLTPIGGFLRRTSLDELPQFINVLQGHMSIVGPRPHALAHNEYYKDLVESYMRRHMVKPGITGWAQVNGYRGETDTLDKMKKRVEYDLWYIDNWSLWLDIKIIIATVFKGFINKNAY
ncbi:undecaprenyl-phosphate glucose phosphotransferase [Rhodanobacter aciditrophus]|uniref:Undecaprenyl-phosphate glucose phosphotransferase n=1 Tax=Rhodanobacter aciditrophus TaxID=1623218 RepID=A0ABW4B2B4_9GAMM